MNYGYACKGWTNEKKKELAQRLRALLVTLELEKDSPDYPYIEVDGLYSGEVRIRRITHLSDETQGKLLIEADKIYEEIVNVF
jgi:hypothetical protein